MTTEEMTPNLKLLIDSLDLQDAYNDYIKNYITLESFAKDYLLTIRQAKIILKAGEDLSNL